MRVVKNILITGVTGFAGSYLAASMSSGEDIRITGTYYSDSSLPMVDEIKDKVSLIKADLSKKEDMERVIHASNPDLVFHLAALTDPAESFKDPSETVTKNIAMEIHLLEGLKEKKETRILIVSSANVYGKVSPEDLPINEEVPFHPVNPYGVSKIAQDYLGSQYGISYDMDIVRVRPFNHIGPKQMPPFVIAAFAKKIAEIEKGKSQPFLEVGNLEAKRDFTDVRDMVIAYDLALSKCKSGNVYNIGSGKSYEIGEILDMFLSLSTVKIEVKREQSLFRPSDIPELVADASKFKKVTDWKPIIPIEKTVKDTLEYWRNSV